MISQAWKKGEHSIIYNIKLWNIKGDLETIKDISEHLKLVQLIETVGNVNHEVSIGRNWIFDSYYDKNLPLAKESMNLICYYSDGYAMYLIFERVYYEARYVKIIQTEDC